MKSFGKILLSILLGLGLAFLGTFLFVGSVTAIITLGPILLPAIAILACAVTISLRFIIPALIKAFSKKVLEFNIKEAIQENDPEKLKLQQWLTVAKKDDPNAIWQFQFSNGESLTEHAFTQSNNHYERSKISLKWHQKLFLNEKDSKHISQSYTRGVVQAWNVFHQPSVTIKPSFYQRFIGKLANLVDLKWGFNAKNDLFKDEIFLDQLKKNTVDENKTYDLEAKPNHPSRTIVQNGIKKIIEESIRERYTPTQIASDATIIRHQMANNLTQPELQPNQTLEEKITKFTTKYSVPEHLEKWQTSIAINHQIDQAHIQQQTITEQQQNMIDITVALQQTQDIKSLWKDDSDITNYEYIKDQIYKPQEKYLPSNTIYWIMNFQDSLRKDGIINKRQHSNFYISNKAIKKITSSGLKSDDFIDHNLPPVGFFVEEIKPDENMPDCETHWDKFYWYKQNNESVFILKYSKARAKYERENLDVSNRLDPDSARGKQSDDCLYQNIAFDNLVKVALANNKLPELLASKANQNFLCTTDINNVSNDITIKTITYKAGNAYNTDDSPLSFYNDDDTKKDDINDLRGGKKAISYFKSELEYYFQGNTKKTNKDFNKAENLYDPQGFHYTTHESTPSTHIITKKDKRLVSNRYRFILTKNATEILEAANFNAALGWKKRYFHYEALPLGLLLQSETEIETETWDNEHLKTEIVRQTQLYTLSYDTKYREEQIQQFEKILRSLQPKFNKAVITDPRLYQPISIEILTTILQEKNILLTQNQISLLQNSGAEPFYEDLLKAITLLASTTTPLHVQKFCKVLETFTSFFINSENSNRTTLVSMFIDGYMNHLYATKDFDTKKPIKLLEQLAKLTPEQAETWLSLMKTPHALSQPNIEEVTQVLFDFINYLNENNLPYPGITLNKLLEQSNNGGNLVKLPGIMSCLAILNYSKIAQNIFLTMLDDMPALSIIKRALRLGYTFVHNNMYPQFLELSFQDLITDFQIINPDEFKAITFRSVGLASAKKSSDFDEKYWLNPQKYSYNWQNSVAKCRKNCIDLTAIYLLYIATNVKPQYVEDAFKKWEKLAGFSIYQNFRSRYGYDDKIPYEPLMKNWERLRDYALSLPKKLDIDKPIEVVSNDNSIVELPDPQADYLLDKDLVEQLQISDDEQKYLESCLNEANTLKSVYQKLTVAELQTQLDCIRKLKPIERLALLREAYYRISYSQSKLDPKEGSWLRLEQFIVVCLSLNDNSRAYQVDTGEGKTLIIQLIALLNALENKKTDIITHNEMLANTGADKISLLASLVKCKVAKKGQSQEDIMNADIFYTDIASDVIRAKQAQINNSPNRTADIEIVDEADNIANNIHGSTTMQISENSGSADEQLEEFLNILNATVRNDLVLHPEINDPINYLKTTLVESLYAKQLSDSDLSKWLEAAVTAMSKILDQDYRVEPKDKNSRSLQVKIVHKTTTGEVDDISQWGKKVHQCVAAWEKYKDPDRINNRIKIPALAKVIAEGDIEYHIKHRGKKTVYALSGTYGHSRLIAKILDILNIGKPLVVMPRAKRAAPSGSVWPRVPKITDESVKQTKVKEEIDDTLERYNRNYHFAPIIIPGANNHIKKLIEVVKTIHNAEQSVMMFFNTIQECKDFHEILSQIEEIRDNAIQILDDTNEDEDNSNSYNLRPSEKVILERASHPGKITLTTAAGSRGTDFENVTSGIIAKPGSFPVTMQKAGRTGRNGQFGMVYEIYCDEDLGLEFKTADKDHPYGKNSTVTLENKNYVAGSYHNILSNHRVFINEYEEKEQEKDLAAIESRAPLRAVKQKVQEEYAKLRSSINDPQQKDKLRENWADFFSSCEDKSIDDIEREWTKLRTTFVR